MPHAQICQEQADFRSSASFFLPAGKKSQPGVCDTCVARAAASTSACLHIKAAALPAVRDRALQCFCQSSHLTDLFHTDVSLCLWFTIKLPIQIREALTWVAYYVQERSFHTIIE